MSSRWLTGAVLILTAFGISSCSGLNSSHPCTDCNSGNATVTVTLFDTPPAGVTFLNFNLAISAITLTPSSGANVNLYAPSSPGIFEATHLQADSDFIGSFTVPTGTYTAMNILLGTSTSPLIINSSTAVVGSCPAGNVCTIAAGAPGQITVTFSPAITLTANQQIGVGLDFSLNNAVTTQNGITVDYTQPNVFTVIQLPRTNQASGTLDTIQNFTGTITAVSSSSVTVTSGTRGALTAALNSSTSLVDPQNKCSVSVASCFANGATVSLDANVNTDGTLTATVLDMLDTTAVDELEGTIYPTNTANVYGLVLFDKTVVSSNTVLTSAAPGTVFSVTAPSGATFSVDTKNFSIPQPSVGFSSAGDIYPGQDVRIHVVSAVAGSGSPPVAAVTTDRAVLRFAALTGTVNTVTNSSIFTVANLPAYLGEYTTPPQVQTYSLATIFDGVTGVTDPNFSVGTTVSFSAIYLNPTIVSQPFLATKIRVP